MARTNQRASPACTMLACVDDIESRGHALLECGGNNGAGECLMRCLRNSEPNLEIEQVLRSDLNVDEEMEISSVWMLASVFLIIWNLRITSLGYSCTR